ncbi:MAG: nickel-dependent lactate racemase [Anaerolineaceae bacterium]|nr:nickel-dependent lactate racemase [Anaerolineaceae bacterium]
MAQLDTPGLFHLPYGSDSLDLRVPPENLLAWLPPGRIEALPDPERAIYSTLDHPVESPVVEALVHAGDKVTILVDDYTRPTPTCMILPCLLERLHAGGIQDRDVTILISTGTHRPCSPSELQKKLGNALVPRLRVVQHDCQDATSQVFLGITSFGTPVWVNRAAVETDHLFGIGHIDPSDYAGYAGGWKLVVPGVAALETINANHALAVLSFRQYGRIDLPCRLDIDAAGSLVHAALFINTVLNQEGQIAAVFAGSPGAVHQAGVNLARLSYEVACPALADICVASAYPYDIDFYQAIRAVEYADRVVRPGGSLLIAAPCPDGTGSREFFDLLSDPDRSAEKFLRKIARREGKVTYNVLGYFLTRILAEKHVYAIMPGIPGGQLEALGLHPVDSLQAGLDALFKVHGQQASVVILPAGSNTIPRIQDEVIDGK